MKKILILFLIALAVGCNDREEVKPVVVDNSDYIYPKHPKSDGKTTSILATCGTGSLTHNLYGSYASPTPWNTTMTQNFQAYPVGYDQITNFTSYLGFYNNSANVVRLYIDGTLVGTIASLGTKKVYFNNASCINGYTLFYTWAVQKQSGPDPGAQIIVTNNIVSGGFTNGNGVGGYVCTIYFQ